METTEIVFVERFEPDKRNLNEIIADNISARGHTAIAGETGQAPDHTTLVVTYVDKWMWDITKWMRLS